MRTASFPLFAVLALAAGCNTFETVDEACLDTAPGENLITQEADREIFRRLQCYRRVAKKTRVPVSRPVQEAAELHRTYVELNAPPPETLRNEVATGEGFTGSGVIARLTAAGFVFPANTEVLEVVVWESGSIAGFALGAEHFDFWFDDPFLRPSWLQPVVTGAGVVEGQYTRVYPPETEVPDLPISYMYWNVLYTVPAQPYAEVPIIYRNGQIDAPGNYVHLSGNQALELGRTYGYPITFTVGTRETGLEVTQASFRNINTGEELPFNMLTGNEAITALRLRNTAIMVPDQALSPGNTYQADVRIKTNQGERKARTTFTVGQNAGRTIPAGLLRRAVELDEPLYDYAIRSTEDPELVGDWDH